MAKNTRQKTGPVGLVDQVSSLIGKTGGRGARRTGGRGTGNGGELPAKAASFVAGFLGGGEQQKGRGRRARGGRARGGRQR